MQRFPLIRHIGNYDNISTQNGQCQIDEFSRLVFQSPVLAVGIFGVSVHIVTVAIIMIVYSREMEIHETG